MANVEEKVEEKYKRVLDNLKVRHYGKTEEINPSITAALKQADSKSGGGGKNYPDIQLLLDNNHGRRIPVMMEAKYRGYKYGGDDHVAVVHTEKLTEGAAKYVTAALHKAAHTGLFSYMNNFYAKDADALNISLPIVLDSDGNPLIETDDGKHTYHDEGYIPDWEYMEKYIRVIEKKVIADVVKYKDQVIDVTRKVVNG